jgi:hypothetical protein
MSAGYVDRITGKVMVAEGELAFSGDPPGGAIRLPGLSGEGPEIVAETRDK